MNITLRMNDKNKQKLPDGFECKIQDILYSIILFLKKKSTVFCKERRNKERKEKRKKLQTKIKFRSKQTIRYF